MLRASLGVEVRRQREERCPSIICCGRDRYVNGRSQLNETLPLGVELTDLSRNRFGQPESNGREGRQISVPLVHPNDRVTKLVWPLNKS